MVMPVKFKVRVIQNEKSVRITIPKELAAHLGLKKGDTVQMWADNNHVILEKARILGD